MYGPYRAIMQSYWSQQYLTFQQFRALVRYLAVLEGRGRHVEASTSPRYGLGSLGSLRPTFFGDRCGPFRLSLIEAHSAHRTSYLIEKTTRKIFRPCARVDCCSITAPQSRSPIAIFLTSTTPEERRQPTTLNHDVEGHPPCADVCSEMLRNGQRQSLTSSPGHRSLSTLFSREFLAPSKVSKWQT